MQKVGRSRTYFFIFSRMQILRCFSGFPENRLTDFWAYYILCFETTYCLSRINTVVVLYLWGIETNTTLPCFSLCSCCTVPMRNWNIFLISELNSTTWKTVLLYCTYEELKLPFPLTSARLLLVWGIRFTIPMRNWNLVKYSVFVIFFLNVVLYLWGIEHRFAWWEIIIQKEIHICMLSSLMMLEQSGLVRLWRYAVSIWFMCFCRYIQTYYCW